MVESIKGKTKYYIYDKKNPKQRIRDTYVEKEAKQYTPPDGLPYLYQP